MHWSCWSELKVWTLSGADDKGLNGERTAFDLLPAAAVRRRAACGGLADMPCSESAALARLIFGAFLWTTDMSSRAPVLPLLHTGSIVPRKVVLPQLHLGT